MADEKIKAKITVSAAKEENKILANTAINNKYPSVQQQLQEHRPTQQSKPISEPAQQWISSLIMLQVSYDIIRSTISFGCYYSAHGSLGRAEDLVGIQFNDIINAIIYNLGFDLYQLTRLPEGYTKTGGYLSDNISSRVLKSCRELETHLRPEPAWKSVIKEQEKLEAVMQEFSETDDEKYTRPSRLRSRLDGDEKYSLSFLLDIDKFLGENGKMLPISRGFFLYYIGETLINKRNEQHDGANETDKLNVEKWYEILTTKEPKLVDKITFPKLTRQNLKDLKVGGGDDDDNDSQHFLIDDILDIIISYTGWELLPRNLAMKNLTFSKK
jgi:hypothetical protein